MPAGKKNCLLGWDGAGTASTGLLPGTRGWLLRVTRTSPFQTQDFLASLNTFPNYTALPWGWGSRARAACLSTSLSG